jgi:hypothetical protein
MQYKLQAIRQALNQGVRQMSKRSKRPLITVIYKDITGASGPGCFEIVVSLILLFMLAVVSGLIAWPF